MRNVYPVFRFREASFGYANRQYLYYAFSPEAAFAFASETGGCHLGVSTEVTPGAALPAFSAGKIPGKDFTDYYLNN